MSEGTALEAPVPTLAGGAPETEPETPLAVMRVLSEQAEHLVESWTHRWKVPALEPVPYPGAATSADWKFCVEGTSKAAGKNHPKAGGWLAQKYLGENGTAADPMLGVGGLWLNAGEQVSTLHGADCEAPLTQMAVENLGRAGIDAVVWNESGRNWVPRNPETGKPVKVSLAMFSPPFRQNHSAGATEHQQEIIRVKNLHQVQAFGQSDDNFANLDEIAYWAAMWEVYARAAAYLAPGGHMVVILRNMIRNGAELDIVGRHLKVAASMTGLEVLGAHPRDLERPTGYQAWKVAKDATVRWVRIEWAIVLRKPAKALGGPELLVEAA